MTSKGKFEWTIAVLAMALGFFFLYKGINKHWLNPCKIYGPDSTIPLAYQQVTTALCESGFLKLVGALQALSGILLFIPRTRLFGAILLFPIILNIFLMHLLMDNRPDELVETGLPLLVNILILAFYYPKWKHLPGIRN
jgi:putative oxidoreductase